MDKMKAERKGMGRGTACERLARVSGWLLGTVFIFSSVFKWIGIRTFALTVDQFCEYLGYGILQGHGMLLAVLVCTFELLLGLSASIPALRDYTRWLFPVVMAYFTYITFLNYTDRYGQIESCGCFGEVVHLTPAESFYKNTVLLAMSLLPLLLPILCCKQKTDV